MPQEPGPALTLGNAVHHALERFFGLPPAERSEATLHKALRAVWRQHVKPGTFASREAEAECGRSALAMLSLFAERFATTTVPLAREQWVSKRLNNGVEIFGKIDRIDAAPNKRLQVVDYKTGRSTLDETDLPTDTAAQVYLTASEARAAREVTRVRIVYLAHGVEVRWEPEREDAEAAEERLIAVTDRIRADREFEATPGSHCSWCPFRLLCPDSSRVGVEDLEVPDDIEF
jgi:putative RecB family exonuclease